MLFKKSKHQFLFSWNPGNVRCFCLNYLFSICHIDTFNSRYQGYICTLDINWSSMEVTWRHWTHLPVALRALYQINPANTKLNAGWKSLSNSCMMMMIWYLKSSADSMNERQKAKVVGKYVCIIFKPSVLSVLQPLLDICLYIYKLTTAIGAQVSVLKHPN